MRREKKSPLVGASRSFSSFSPGGLGARKKVQVQGYEMYSKNCPSPNIPPTGDTLNWTQLPGRERKGGGGERPYDTQHAHTLRFLKIRKKKKKIRWLDRSIGFFFLFGIHYPQMKQNQGSDPPPEAKKRKKKRLQSSGSLGHDLNYSRKNSKREKGKEKKMALFIL